MDFMGPFKPPSSQGNKYIMVVTDYFSKYVEVRALPDQTAITTADAFLDMVVRRHGTPKAIVSDRGVNFTSKNFRHLCKTLGIQQKFST
jgi:transposase InsO family protein